MILPVQLQNSPIVLSWNLISIYHDNSSAQYLTWSSYLPCCRCGEWSTTHLAPRLSPSLTTKTSTCTTAHCEEDLQISTLFMYHRKSPCIVLSCIIASSFLEYRKFASKTKSIFCTFIRYVPMPTGPFSIIFIIIMKIFIALIPEDPKRWSCENTESSHRGAKHNILRAKCYRESSS